MQVDQGTFSALNIGSRAINIVTAIMAMQEDFIFGDATNGAVRFMHFHHFQAIAVIRTIQRVIDLFL